LTEDQIDDYAAAFDEIPRLVETTVRTTYQSRGQMPRHGVPVPYADGGYVPGFADGGLPGFPSGGLFRGVGGPREDANLVAISDGEFIVNARDTARHRSLLEAINSGRRLSMWNGMDRNMSPGLPMAGMGAVGNSTVTIRFDFANVSTSAMARALREVVYFEGGGNAQIAFGTR